MELDFIEHPSPNFDERQLPVSMIVLHYTGMPDMQSALDRLTSPEARVSSHYLVGLPLLSLSADVVFTAVGV